MNNNIYTSQKDSGCGRTVENEKRFNTNDNNNNGDDFMKLLTKKQFKGLRKGQAYVEYKSVGELAEAYKHKADVAEALFRDAKIDAEAAKSLLNDAKADAENAKADAENAKADAENAKADAENAKADAENAKADAENAKKRAELAEKKADEAELRATIAEGKADAGLDLVSELQNDLDDLIEARDETMETYNRLGARMTGKINRANINTGTIRHYKNIIHQCKKDIEAGKDVGGNKATINELEAEIRNLQRQVEAAKGTFHEMKHNKTIVSQRIDSMDDELNKRYKLNNLLGELGYI